MKNTGNEIITSVKELLTKPELQIAVVMHENADGDAMGSAIGLAEILIGCGHRLSVISPNDYPFFLKWFDTGAEVVIAEHNKRKTQGIFESADLLFCVDFNEVSRTGYLQELVGAFDRPRILIDHHPDPVYFCEYTISEPHYSSTAELIYDLVHEMDLGENINHNAAVALYTGILTDTGSFSHNTSDPNTFKVVAKLMNFGIDTEGIQSLIYHNFSADRMQLLGYCLGEKMEVFPEYRTAVISLSKEEMERFSFKPGDSEGFVNYPLSIKNIIFSAFFVEKEGFIKASFRSKGNFATNTFSRNHFNGGGHMNASGGELFATLEEALKLFKGLLPNYKEELLKTEL